MSALLLHIPHSISSLGHLKTFLMPVQHEAASFLNCGISPCQKALACQAILAETWRLWEPSQTGDQGKHWPKAQIHQELFVRLQLSAATTEAGFFFFYLVIRLELQEVKQDTSCYLTLAMPPTSLLSHKDHRKERSKREQSQQDSEMRTQSSLLRNSIQHKSQRGNNGSSDFTKFLNFDVAKATIKIRRQTES